MGTTDRKNIGKKAAVLAVLIGVFSGFTSQAAGDVFSTADSQPDTQTVQFRDSAPYVCTEIAGSVSEDNRAYRAGWKDLGADRHPSEAGECLFAGAG